MHLNDRNLNKDFHVDEQDVNDCNDYSVGVEKESFIISIQKIVLWICFYLKKLWKQSIWDAEWEERKISKRLDYVEMQKKLNENKAFAWLPVKAEMSVR